MADVICKWKRKNRFLINPDGQVMPCCYLANAEYFRDVTGANPDIKYPIGPRTYIMERYAESKEDLNAFNKPLEEVLNHPWWNELEESWKNPEHTDRRCIRYCSKGDNTPR